jgi:Flp pilus assembly protein TadD
MKAITAALAWVGLSAFAYAQTEPSVIIIQRVPSFEGKPMSSDFVFRLYEQLHQNFNMKLILWGLGDETYRRFAYDGLLPTDVADPSDAQLASAVRSIKADFSIIVDLTSDPGLKGSRIRVFRGGPGRPAWEKTLKSEIMVSGIGKQSEIDSTVARTWTLELISGPFKPFQKATTTGANPEPELGPTITPDPPRNAPNPLEKIRSEANALILNNQSAQAVELYFTEIDRQPLQPEIRQWLIELLLQRGQNELAAQEARRALLLFPGDPVLRVLRMRCLMQIGQYQEALTELNEALTRDPENPEFLEMSGHIQLARGNYSAARTSYLKSLTKGPRITTQAGLAIVVALEGDTAEVKNLITTMGKPTSSELNEMYSRLAVLTGLSIDRIAEQYREMMQSARLRLDPKLADQAQRLYKSCEGLSVLAEVTPFPQNHQGSHAKRIVAYKLLVQAAAEVLQYMRTGENDAGDEASISLSEALSRCSDVKRLFEAE